MHLNSEQMATWRSIARRIASVDRMEYLFDSNQGKELMAMLNDVAVMSELREKIQKIRAYLHHKPTSYLTVGQARECEKLYAELVGVLLNYCLIPQERNAMEKIAKMSILIDEPHRFLGNHRGSHVH